MCHAHIKSHTRCSGKENTQAIVQKDGRCFSYTQIYCLLLGIFEVVLIDTNSSYSVLFTLSLYWLFLLLNLYLSWTFYSFTD